MIISSIAKSTSKIGFWRRCRQPQQAENTASDFIPDQSREPDGGANRRETYHAAKENGISSNNARKQREAARTAMTKFLQPAMTLLALQDLPNAAALIQRRQASIFSWRAGTRPSPDRRRSQSGALVYHEAQSPRAEVIRQRRNGTVVNASSYGDSPALQGCGANASDSRTPVGICRSESENFAALWSIRLASVRIVGWRRGCHAVGGEICADCVRSGSEYRLDTNAANSEGRSFH